MQEQLIEELVALRWEVALLRAKLDVRHERTTDLEHVVFIIAFRV